MPRLLPFFCMPADLADVDLSAASGFGASVGAGVVPVPLRVFAAVPPFPLPGLGAGVVLSVVGSALGLTETPIAAAWAGFAVGGSAADLGVALGATLRADLAAGGWVVAAGAGAWAARTGCASAAGAGAGCSCAPTGPLDAAASTAGDGEVEAARPGTPGAAATAAGTALAGAARAGAAAAGAAEGVPDPRAAVGAAPLGAAEPPPGDPPGTVGRAAGLGVGLAFLAINPLMTSSSKRPIPRMA